MRVEDGLQYLLHVFVPQLIVFQVEDLDFVVSQLYLLANCVSSKSSDFILLQINHSRIFADLVQNGDRAVAPDAVV